MDWKVYYGDGLTFSSNNGEPSQAPPYNVMAVVQLDKRTGISVYNQWDWYFYSTGINKWFGADLFGVMDQIMHNCEKIKGVIQGRVTTSEKFQEILNKARNDKDFPRKSANGKWETRSQKYGDGQSE